MPRRLLILLMLLTFGGTTVTGGAAQPATPVAAEAAVADHLAWVLTLFEGAAETLTEAEVEARFAPLFLAVVPADELIATVGQLAELLGPLELLEDRSTSPGEFIGVFRSASGEGVMISFAIDPATGLIAGFFITPAPLPSANPSASPAASPVATPSASPAARALGTP